jgi:hypothetical protein
MKAETRAYIVDELEDIMFDIENHVDEDELYERITNLQDYVEDND